MLKRVTFLGLLLSVAVFGVLWAMREPVRLDTTRPAIPFDGKACPPGYVKGIFALRPSSPENPLRLDQPEGNWKYVCLATR
jgi:hypothetical protein